MLIRSIHITVCNIPLKADGPRSHVALCVSFLTGTFHPRQSQKSGCSVISLSNLMLHEIV